MQENYKESISIIKRAASLDFNNSEAHRELGISYGKLKKYEQAIESLDEAVRLTPQNAEALRNSGGEHRRWDMKDVPNNINWDSLKIARDRYLSASKIEPYDTYSLLNVAKLELLISKIDPSRRPIAEESYKKLKPLCEFNVSDYPNDYWRRFDLAESTFFQEI